MKKEDEVVLVVNQETLFETDKLTGERCSFQGLLSNEDDVEKYMELISSNYESMRRGDVDETDRDLSECAERNKSFKQPIPYIVIRKADEFYVTERLEGGGESRLHGKLSMGVGGHMNPIDGYLNFDDLLQENTMRELTEELNVEYAGETLDLKMNGLVNDDLNEVGKVHIGLLGKIDLKEEQSVSIREVEQLKGSWYTLDELLAEDTFHKVEAWGQIVIEAIKAGKIK